MIVAVAIRRPGVLHMLTPPQPAAVLVKAIVAEGGDAAGEIGFIDDAAGFVDRKRAAAIARTAGQSTEFLR